MPGIGELNQSDLHDQLKLRYCGSDGEMEVEVAGFVVDVLLPNEIVEIQTRNVGKLKRKLAILSEDRRVRVVHPIAGLKYLTKVDAEGKVLSRRRSPRKGRVEEAFREISSISDLLPNPNIIVEIVVVAVTEYRLDDGRGSWRRKGVSVVGRQLDEIIEHREFQTAGDYLRLLPDDLTEEFTNRDLSDQTGLRYLVVQPITSTLRKMGLIVITGKAGRSLTYRRA